ncbi:hypothetical protein NB699_001592 [Xanthomonas sacchari]|uniref:Uncharacterized protein n=1 Tax=Xanthomonas sacchari TaxID=56458 RepID=A0AA46QAX9_9XANT|nr:hypothetical protein [Xanthomonas sacchari]MCW0366609.1 hypothetical protein [Xanthomonas sacchari]MCW0440366.1 hypothetical protein [Xanthomonas sacchari]UYK87055.1 hypothetical protein NG824_11015 [Xanthomonas sacchari]
MIDILPRLLEATASLQRQMQAWFSGYSPGMPWTVVSDYCIGDVNKPNDVISLVVIANHDTADAICEYLGRVAPKDLKNTNQVPLGLVQYLTCPQPITFSLSFVLRRDEALLRRYLQTAEMADFLPDACEMMKVWRDNSGDGNPYYEQAIKRFKLFEQDLRKKQVNEKLARQIHFTASAVAIVFHLLTESTRAGFLRWISDRDALLERYDMVVYDIAYFYFLLLRSEHAEPAAGSGGIRPLSVPSIMYEMPERTGRHRFDEMVRLPDYLAGTLADLSLNLDGISFSREKFETVFANVFVNSPNNWIVQLLSDTEKVTVRSVRFQT